MLRAVAGNDIRYLDERLGVPPRDEHRVLGRPDESTCAQLADLVVHAEIWLRHQGRTWTSLDEFADALAHGPAGADRLQDAIEAGILIVEASRPDEAGSCRKEIQLAPDHHLVKAVRHLLAWVPGRIRHCLRNKGMPYVDTKYLFDGMRMDVVCQRCRIGQTRRDAESWLERLAKANVITKKIQPHPSTPTNLIATWELPASHQLPPDALPFLHGGADRRSTSLQARTRVHSGQAVSFSRTESHPTGLE